MSTIGKTMVVKGVIRSGEDLTVNGRIDGQIFCETACVVIGPSAEITGDVLARDITVHGRHAGQLVATDIVDVRAEGNVSGQVVSRRFVLDPAATFKARVEPQHLDAAIHVLKYHQKKREEAAAAR
jgi:cytoskeletal protein CcmA (bactofilin family)